MRNVHVPMLLTVRWAAIVVDLSMVVDVSMLPDVCIVVDIVGIVRFVFDCMCLLVGVC